MLSNKHSSNARSINNEENDSSKTQSIEKEDEDSFDQKSIKSNSTSANSSTSKSINESTNEPSINESNTETITEINQPSITESITEINKIKNTEYSIDDTESNPNPSTITNNDGINPIPTPFRKLRRSKSWTRERSSNFKMFLSNAGRYFIDEEIDIFRAKIRDLLQWSISPPPIHPNSFDEQLQSHINHILNTLKDPWIEKILALNSFSFLNHSPCHPHSKIGFSLQIQSHQESFAIHIVKQLAINNNAIFIDFDILFLRVAMHWFVEDQINRFATKEVQTSLEQFQQELQRNDDDFILFLDDLFYLIDQDYANLSKKENNITGNIIGTGSNEIKPDSINSSPSNTSNSTSNITFPPTPNSEPIKYIILLRNLNILRSLPHQLLRERLNNVKSTILFIDLSLETHQERATFLPISIVAPNPPINSSDEEEYSMVSTSPSITSEILHRELFSKFKNLIGGKTGIDTLKSYRSLFGDEPIDLTRQSFNESTPNTSSSHLHSDRHIQDTTSGSSKSNKEPASTNIISESFLKAHEFLSHHLICLQNLRNLKACFHLYHIQLIHPNDPNSIHNSKSDRYSWLDGDIQYLTVFKMLFRITRLLQRDDISKIVSHTLKFYQMDTHQKYPPSISTTNPTPIIDRQSQKSNLKDVDLQQVSAGFLRLLDEEQLSILPFQLIDIKYLLFALELEVGMTPYYQSSSLNMDPYILTQSVNIAYQEDVMSKFIDFQTSRESQQLDMLRIRLQSHNLSQTERRIFDSYVQPSKMTITFDDIGSLDHAKEELMSLVVPMKVSVFQINKLIKNPLGILLYGPPGTGKTMLARALAKTANANFIHISISTIVSKWLGESEGNAAAVFSLARKISPCIIFIDEVDGLLNTREASEHESSRRVKNEFFSGWDGLLSLTNDPNISVTVIAATNRPFDLDAAALRRLPHRVMVPMPDRESRVKILQKTLKDIPIVHGMVLEKDKENGDTYLVANEIERFDMIHQLSDLMEGYSGSDIKSLCTRAALQLVRDFMSDGEYKQLQALELEEGKEFVMGESQTMDKIKKIALSYAMRPLTMNEFKKALGEISKSVDPRSRTQLELKKWHETYGSKQGKAQTPRDKLGF